MDGWRTDPPTPPAAGDRPPPTERWTSPPTKTAASRAWCAPGSRRCRWRHWQGGCCDSRPHDGRHDEVLDAPLAGLDQYLDEHRDELRVRLAQQSPWWLPGAVEDRIFERLLDGARAVIGAMAADPDHHLRRELDERLVQLANDLETSPELRERGEQLKHELLSPAAAPRRG